MRYIDIKRLDAKEWDGRTVFEVISVHGKDEYSQGLYGTEELAVKSIALSPMIGTVTGRGINQTLSNRTKFKIIERRVIEE